MRKIAWLIPLLLALTTTQAHAWFFIFIPGALVGKVSDAITGAEGDSCVGETAKVGDVIKSLSGNTATVKSLSGKSSRCRDPKLPIRAALIFNFSFSSKAGINLPDGFEQKPLSDMQRFKGILLKAEDASKKTGVVVSARPRTEATDPVALAQNTESQMSAVLDDPKTSNPEELTIKGRKAWRFEIEGKSKAIFGQRHTYVVTVLESSQELLVVNAWARTDNIDQERESLRQLAYGVEGLEPIPSAPTPNLPASAPEQAPGGAQLQATQ